MYSYLVSPVRVSGIGGAFGFRVSSSETLGSGGLLLKWLQESLAPGTAGRGRSSGQAGRGKPTSSHPQAPKPESPKSLKAPSSEPLQPYRKGLAGVSPEQ